MEPLFSAVICGCNAGLFREALHEVYIPRIQRGTASFAAKFLGVTGPLLSILIHFFQGDDFGRPLEVGVGEQSLTPEDRLFVLMQAAQYLTTARGLAAPEVRICYERAESLCHSAGSPAILCVALAGQWRYTLVTSKLSAARRVAERVHSLAHEQNNPALMIEAYRALAVTHHYLGDFEASRRYAMRGAQIWRSERAVLSGVEDPIAPAVACIYYEAVIEWHFGEIDSCQAIMAQAISLAKELNDRHGLANTLWHAASLAQYERNPAEVECYSSELIELSTRHNFAFWLSGGAILRGWARSASGDTAKGLAWIEDGIEGWMATGAVLNIPYFLALKAEALQLGDRTPEALEAISEAEALVERFEDRHWSAELNRLRGVLLAAVGADETQIEASFCEAIRIAKEQKSISLEKRAEATYAEYHRQKASGLGGRGIRLPL